MTQPESKPTTRRRTPQSRKPGPIVIDIVLLVFIFVWATSVLVSCIAFFMDKPGYQSSSSLNYILMIIVGSLLGMRGKVNGNEKSK